MAERVRQAIFGEQVSVKDAVQSSKEKSVFHLIFETDHSFRNQHWWNIEFTEL
jgi:hypothetical protein